MLIYENLSKITVRNIEAQSHALLMSYSVFLLDVILNVWHWLFVAELNILARSVKERGMKMCF